MQHRHLRPGLAGCAHEREGMLMVSKSSKWSSFSWEFALTGRLLAQPVKLEGVRGHAEIVCHIVESGVPVMGHVGLTPQSINMLGGMKAQTQWRAPPLQ